MLYDVARPIVLVQMIGDASEMILMPYLIILVSTHYSLVTIKRSTNEDLSIYPCMVSGSVILKHLNRYIKIFFKNNKAS